MVRKNANGEGSRPRKRPDGRWEARYWSEGRRRSVYRETRKEVAEKLAKAMAAKEDPPTFVPLPIKGDALVFRNKAGKPLNPSHLCCRSFEPLLKRAGLQIPPFMLRLVILAAASS